MTGIRLNPELVEEIFMDCLFNLGEDTSQNIKAEGVTRTVGFHPARLAGHRDKIAALLFELPDGFMKSKGGGASFLSACEDRHGTQWTGMHLAMEQLFQLGIGVGMVSCPMDRSMWMSFPGGMPYYTIDDTGRCPARKGIA